jgi:SAM-dependent methyltransferase
VDRASAAYDPELYARLAELERGHFWFEVRNELITWALGRYFPDARDYLEVGCGTGFVLEGVRTALPSLRVTGVDLYEEGLAVARERVEGARIRRVDDTGLPYRDEFDLVGVFDVLEHVDEDERMLAEIHAALRPGGGLAITVPQHPWLWGPQDEAAHHVRRYKRRELVAKVERAGFAIERVTSFVSLLLPAMIASRLRKRRGGAPDPLEEMRIGRRLNAFLARVLRAELGLIRRGVSLPAGGSLLVIARAEPARVESTGPGANRSLTHA